MAEEKKNDCSRSHRVWSEEDTNYLCEFWGIYSTPAIAKNLKRSVSAVKCRASELGLGKHLENSGFISLRTILREMGYENTHSWFSKKLIDAGLPFRLQKVEKSSFRVVNIDEFWDFMEQHQDLMSFANLEINVLGKEPDWVKKKRKEEYQKAAKNICANDVWRKEDDSRLIQLIKENYTYAEIATKMCRSKDAIRNRACLLRKTDNYSGVFKRGWNQNNENVLYNLLKEDKPVSEIASVLGKTHACVKGKIYRMFNVNTLAEAQQAVLSKELSKSKIS